MLLHDAILQFRQWKQIGVTHSTAKSYFDSLRQFYVFMRGRHIEEVKLNDVTAFINLFGELGLKPHSLMLKSIALRKFFEYWTLNNYKVLNHQLIPIPKRDYVKPRIATEEQYRKVLAVIEDGINRGSKESYRLGIRNRAIAKLLWDSGCRVGELVALDTDDFKMHQRSAVIRTEKSRGIRPIRQIFWTKGTHDDLLEWLALREEMQRQRSFETPKALFVGLKSRTYGRRMTSSGIEIALRKYSIIAGVPTMNPHSLRHHFGHEIIHSGGSSADVMNFLGHSSLASSTPYTRMQDQELEERYRKFKGH